MIILWARLLPPSPANTVIPVSLAFLCLHLGPFSLLLLLKLEARSPIPSPLPRSPTSLHFLQIPGSSESLQGPDGCYSSESPRAPFLRPPHSYLPPALYHPPPSSHITLGYWLPKRAVFVRVWWGQAGKGCHPGLTSFPLDCRRSSSTPTGFQSGGRILN